MTKHPSLLLCLLPLAFSLPIGFAGCGGGGGGNPDLRGINPDLRGINPVPVDHMLAQAQATTFNAHAFYGFNFVLPAQASVNFSVSETTTDTWNVAIWNDTQWTSWQNGTANQPTADPHNNVMSVTDSATLPAGSWWLGFRCDNALERCMFVFNLDATY